MILKNTKQNRQLAAVILKRGGVGVMPSDTLYGIMGSALNPVAVKRIYKLRKRNIRKPFLVLIKSPSDLKKFGIAYRGDSKIVGNRFWPGGVTIIFPCPNKKFSYLHRGTNTVAFRVPKSKWLREFLRISGPLVAPSANWEGSEPALTVTQARRYFGNNIEFYLDGNKRQGLPSTVIGLKKGKIVVVRQGRVRIPSNVL
ncbi:MAG: hypothetical protein UX65_C0001G0081 [Parcubacteria group bacterium GW2011_GWB1_46_8]|nr:MAG: hypothetical protein UX65_C0001G0081 [Parcubacteria group bacterium GW2011_GWB1_46_8]KKU46994.1 MAG: hypothetical protein UX66_C0028G0004 [Parcubacteria group bacterium GW2011_GWF2_46_8]